MLAPTLARKKSLMNDQNLNLFDDFFNGTFLNKPDNNISLNIRENEKQYIYEFYLTGFNKEDIDLDLNNNFLTVNVSKTDKSNNDYVYQESSINTSRTIKLPNNVNKETISANFENGILYLTIEKTQQNNINSYKIPIK